MSTRVSTAQLYQNVHQNVATAREREITSSNKAATGMEITKPSQDPAGWLQSAALKDGLSMRENMTRNASVAQHMLDANDGVLSQLQDSVQRAYELAVQASGDTLSHENRIAIREEIVGLYQNSIAALNTQYQNRSLLAGYATDRPAFARDGAFLGDNGSFEIEVTKNLKVPLNLSGERVVYGEGDELGVNLLETMSRLCEGLCYNDTGLIQSTLDDFRQGNDQISRARAEVGARMSQVKNVIDSNELRSIDDKDAISRISEADMIKVLSELARDQTVVKAAISSGQELLKSANETTQMMFPSK